MRSPLASRNLLELAEVTSTQDVAAQWLAEGDELGRKVPGGILAAVQTQGKGRLGRGWHTQPNGSLALSLIFSDYADHPRPWLIGMCVGLAAAGFIHSQLQWPNDLVYEKRKVGGILTEVMIDRLGRRVPVVGIGINLRNTALPSEIASFATSVETHEATTIEPLHLARAICERLLSLPEPDRWASLAPIWSLFDDTPGKPFRLPDGRVGTAISIGPDGELIVSVDGDTCSIVAAEALWGQAESPA